MRKILITLLCVGCFSALWAGQDVLLNFYQRESIAKGRNARQDRAFAAALAQDVAQWLAMHPNHEQTKQALLLKADLQQRAEQNAQALVTWYQVRFHYPSSQDVVALTANVDQMMEDLNYRQKGKALQLLTVDTSSLPAGQAREAALLTHMVQTNLEKVYQPVNELFELYFTRYPKSEELDRITLLYGDWHRQNGNYQAAIVQYKKVHELFPKTPYMAASLRMMADVYAADLKDYETATALYDQVLKNYPDSAEIGIVYKHMAVMEENQKHYEEALVYYDKAIADLGNKPAAYEAWQGKADVLLKMKSYQAAYDTLIQGANVFDNDEKKFVALFRQAIDVAEDRLKNRNLQIAALSKVLALYPQNQYAPEMSYQLGQIYEKQGKNMDAKLTYKWLILSHPTDKWASKAQGRLDRLEK